MRPRRRRGPPALAPRQGPLAGWPSARCPSARPLRRPAGVSSRARSQRGKKQLQLQPACSHAHAKELLQCGMQRSKVQQAAWLAGWRAEARHSRPAARQGRTWRRGGQLRRQHVAPHAGLVCHEHLPWIGVRPEQAGCLAHRLERVRDLQQGPGVRCSLGGQPPRRQGRQLPAPGRWPGTGPATVWTPGPRPRQSCGRPGRR